MLSMAISDPHDVRWQDHVSVNPEICHGQPCVTGTRIPVGVVLDNLAAGLTFDELIREYPSLTPRTIRGVLAYASALTRDELLAVPYSA